MVNIEIPESGDRTECDRSVLCLELEPQARPRIAGLLAERIARYLELVEAKLRDAELAKVNAQVRAEELGRRQTLALRAGGAVAASLLIGFAASAWQASRANSRSFAACLSRR